MTGDKAISVISPPAKSINSSGRLRALVPFGVLLIGEIFVLLVSRSNSYYLSIGLQWATFALLAQGFNIIAGYGGRLAFGNTIFFGLSAYLVAAGAFHHWYPELVGFVLAIAVCSLLAYAMSLALWRVNGLLFALATFAISAMLEQLAAVFGTFGGSAGIQEPLAVKNSFIHLSLTSQYGYLVIGAGLVLLGSVITWWFVRSTLGREAQAVRDDRVAASTSGINTRQVTALVWVISAALTAVAGVFYAQFNLFVDPASAFGLSTITLIVVPAILGGMGTVWGPVVGSIIIPIGLFLAQLSRSGGISGLNSLVYGAVLILVLRLYPGGLTAILAALRRSAIFSARNENAAYRVGSLGAGFSPGTRVVPENTALKSSDPTVPEERRSPNLGSVLLEVKDVRKSFGGVHALQGVTFSVHVGEIIGLIGPNGAGKSTMFNCIAGVESPDSGVVRFDGRDITRATSYERARAGISRTYQTVRLFPQLTALENVAVGTLRRSGRETAAHRAAVMLESVGLADKAYELAGSLTLVDQRRLELARAMVTDARLVMLDEVMTGLNETEAEGMRVMVRELNDYHSTAFVIVEHVMGHILPLISRVVIMDQGRVLADGNPEVVLNQSDVIEAYFGRSAAEDDNDGD